MDELTPGNPFDSDDRKLQNPSLTDTASLRMFLGMEGSLGEPLFTLGGHYHVYQVRRGGMGEVFLCTRESFGDILVALKSFQKRFFFEPSVRNAFVREVRIWSQLSGLPNIVPVLGLEYIDDRPFVLMQGMRPIESGSITVRDVLKQQLGPLPPHQAFIFAYQTATGMFTAQQKLPGLVHGDLKPENLLLMGDTILYISDFGLARVIDQMSPEPNLLESTWAYRAPEVWRSPTTLAAAADIYAFGVILFELLTGKRPFTASTRNEWEHAHLSLSPSLPESGSFGPDVEACMEIALRCLSKDIEARPPTFQDIHRELDRIGSDFFHQAQHDFDMFGLITATAFQPDFQSYAIQTLLAGGQFEAALEELEHIPKDMYDAAHWHMLGNALSLHDRDEEAISAFEQALELNPEKKDLLSDYALSLKRLRRFHEAEAIYEELLEDSEDNNRLRASSNLATVYLESERAELAAELLENTVRKYPKSATVWTNLGNAYDMLQRYEDAAKCYQRALGLAPHMTNVYMLLASVLMDQLGRIEEAVIVLELAGRQGEQSYNLAVRLIACNELLDNAEYVAGYYEQLAQWGNTPAEISKLHDDVQKMVERVAPSYARQHDPIESTSEESVVATAPEFPPPLPPQRQTAREGWLSRLWKMLRTLRLKPAAVSIAANQARSAKGNQEATLLEPIQGASIVRGAQESAEPVVITDGHYGEGQVGFPFINVRFYATEFGQREYSLDFYDDVYGSEFVAHFDAKYQEAKHQLVADSYAGMRDVQPSLRPNMFYFTGCPQCNATILTNRDEMKELKCRRCGAVHNSSPIADAGLQDVLDQIEAMLGRTPMPMNDFLQIVVIQPRDPSQAPLVEIICTELGFARVSDKSPISALVVSAAYERGLLSENQQHSVWQKLASGGTRISEDAPPPDVALLQRTLDRKVPVRSLNMVLNTRNRSPMNLVLQGRLSEAEDVLQKELLAGDKSKATLELLVDVLRREKRYAEAYEKATVLTQFYPDSNSAWKSLGNVEMEWDHYDRAIAAFEQAHALDPTNWQTLAFLANCYSKVGQSDRAQSYAALARSLGAVHIKI